jgi:hypothetical protein
MARVFNIMEWKFVAPGYTSERRFEIVTDPEVVEQKKAQIEFLPCGDEFTYHPTDRPDLVRELISGTWPGEEG